MWPLLAPCSVPRREQASQPRGLGPFVGLARAVTFLENDTRVIPVPC